MCEIEGSFAKIWRIPIASHCNTLQHIATHCNTLQHTASHCTTQEQTAQHNTYGANTLQRITTLCNTLQHITTLCNTLQHKYGTSLRKDGEIFVYEILARNALRKPPEKLLGDGLSTSMTLFCLICIPSFSCGIGEMFVYEI